jgi:hypothetical protein
VTDRMLSVRIRNSECTSRLEDVKKSIWPKSKLMQNVCRRPSDRLLGILARLFLEPKFPHTNLSLSSHLPVTRFRHQVSPNWPTKAAIR